MSWVLLDSRDRLTDIYHGCDTGYGANVSWTTGGRLNKKDGLTRYGNSHVKDKTS